MGVKKQVTFSIDKQKALKIAKKAVTAKFAIVKDDGFTFKVGAPMMTATIEVGDGVITISGGGPGATIANTAYEEINNAFEEMQEQEQAAPVNSAPAASQPKPFSIDDQLKIVEVLKAFKELLDSGIITEEEFTRKKTELLEATSITPKQPQSEPKQEVVAPVIEPQPVEEPIEQPKEEVQAPVEEPINEAPVEQPIVEEVIEEPVPETPVEEPVEEQPVEEPVEVVEAPVVEFDLNRILGDDSKEEEEDAAEEESVEEKPAKEEENIDYEALTDKGREYFNHGRKYKKAVECFEKAAKGSARAKYNLYICYMYGYGVKKDSGHALILLQEAAEAGFEKAITESKKYKD